MKRDLMRPLHCKGAAQKFNHMSSPSKMFFLVSFGLIIGRNPFSAALPTW